MKAIYYRKHKRLDVPDLGIKLQNIEEEEDFLDFPCIATLNRFLNKGIEEVVINDDCVVRN